LPAAEAFAFLADFIQPRAELPPNQALHHDWGRILVSRDTTPLQRPRRVNSCVRG
jgi:hypothetical protein